MEIHPGTIPERDSDDKLYNTCTVYDPEGKGILIMFDSFLSDALRKSHCHTPQSSSFRHRYTRKNQIQSEEGIASTKIWLTLSQESEALTGGADLNSFDTGKCSIFFRNGLFH